MIPCRAERSKRQPHGSIRTLMRGQVHQSIGIHRMRRAGAAATGDSAPVPAERIFATTRVAGWERRQRECSGYARPRCRPLPHLMGGALCRRVGCASLPVMVRTGFHFLFFAVNARLPFILSRVKDENAVKVGRINTGRGASRGQGSNGCSDAQSQFSSVRHTRFAEHRIDVVAYRVGT